MFQNKKLGNPSFLQELVMAGVLFCRCSVSRLNSLRSAGPDLGGGGGVLGSGTPLPLPMSQQCTSVYSGFFFIPAFFPFSRVSSILDYI